MIGRLKGTVETLGESLLILDVHGVGYEIHASARTLRTLQLGQEVALAIDTHVRDDAIRLYGFASETERAHFRLLQTVQGVGARLALALLSTLSAQELGAAIGLQNWAALSEAPGVGKKLAQRIVAELKDKALALPLTGARQLAAGQRPVVVVENTATAEAISALTNLGYQAVQASQAVAAAAAELGAAADTAKLIRRGLQELAR